MTHRGNGDGSPDELDSVGTPPPRLQNQHSASSSPLSSLGATPSLESYVPETRPLGVYNDMVPANKPFWVEINPKGDSFNRDDFIMNEEEFRIVGIFGDIGEGDDISYECQFEDDHTAIIPVSKLFSYTNGDVALREYMKFSKGRKRLRIRRPVQVDPSSEDDVASSDPQFESPRAKRRRTLRALSQKVSRRTTRAQHHGGTLLSLNDGYREDESDITLSDASAFRQGTRKSSRTQKKRYSSLRHEVSDFSDEEESEEPSGITSRSSAKPRQKKAQEIFPMDEQNTEFAKRHHYWCMLSTHWNAIKRDDKRSYAMCQGCSFMYHIECLGQKGDRMRTGHNVIVLEETAEVKKCVLQCGKCAGGGKNGVMTTRCFACGQVGPRCGEFVPPEKVVGEELHGWNDGSKVMFRCMGCERACHFDHLPSPKTDPDDMPVDKNVLDVYTSGHWRCNECREYEDKKVDVVLGWRPTKTPLSDDIPIDFNCEYLVKFDDESYARALWVPATWLAGVSYSMKSNYDAKHLPSISSSEDVIPDAWLRPDIVFDVRYNDDMTRDEMRFRSQSDELEAVTKVTYALCKWQKLKYEESIAPLVGYRLTIATWETPPLENSPRWGDFKTAYDHYVRGQWIHSPNYRGQKSPYADPSKSEDVIQAEFGQRMEKKDQPAWVQGGDMFDYQLEGMNWLYFQWYKQTSAILADEMGLGKTIQIIAVIATIFKEHQRWPFLVIAPNSTIENWKREFRKWAPSLRVVAWPGTTEGRELVLCHSATDLKAHVVITGYGTARTTISFLRKFAWECLIVDEGQALKNDKSELFQELCTLNVQHRIILTGTPLQNNIRELFNIMQFLDPTQFHAEKMEEQYEELDEQRVREIHAMLRPRFLRRTKADVLTFLPSKSEIIIPLSMSSVQKELYKSIVSQNSDLMKAITRRVKKGQTTTAKSNIPKLQNILMQLRKCLAHPFVQAPDLEDRNVERDQQQRALVEASGKLSFLARILPKLKERGHRVLIFSQFLDMLDLLEDFLEGIGFRYGRLDGKTATLERQHMIDEFNSPDSTMDCFLLSTRAGGAGINLATADTVIVYDPDHNPHQDMQALARAHRIGQEKKVLVFRLMTRNTVEEKIYQTSKKKMVLDHLIVESLDNNEEKLDVQALLLHGLKALFEDTPEKDIKYDDNDIEKLLDRSQFEETVQQSTGGESLGSFKTARIWANSTAQLEDLPEDGNNDILEVGYWDQIIQERLSLAETQKLAEEEEHGRGRRRAQKKVDYRIFDSSPLNPRSYDPFDDYDADPLPLSESDAQDDDDFRDLILAEDSDESGELDPDQVDKDVVNLQDPEKRRSVFADNTIPSRKPYPSPQRPELRLKHWDPPGMPHIHSPSRPGSIDSEAMLSHTGRTPTMSLPAGMRSPHASRVPVQTHSPTSERNINAISREVYDNLQAQSLPALSPPTATSRNHPSQTPPKPSRLVSSTPPPLQPTMARHRSPSRSHTNRTPILGDVPVSSHGAAVKCRACYKVHIPGRCPLRDVDIQQCPACGYFHLHTSRACPLLQKPEYIEMIHQRLKESNEVREVVKAAKSYIIGVRADWALRQAGGRNKKTDKT